LDRRRITGLAFQRRERTSPVDSEIVQDMLCPVGNFRPAQSRGIGAKTSASGLMELTDCDAPEVPANTPHRDRGTRHVSSGDDSKHITTMCCGRQRREIRFQLSIIQYSTQTRVIHNLLRTLMMANHLDPCGGERKASRGE